MRIYRPKGITKGQIVLCTVLGVFAGVYIWRPIFDEHFPRQKRAVEAPADVTKSD